MDYMNLALKDGGVALTVQLGTGKLDTAIKPASVSFDDNAWHHVVVSRKSAEVTLTVDGLYTERWMTSGSFSLLASNTAFLGGSEATYSLPGTKTNNNLVGCLKKATYRADSLFLDFLKLAQNGNPLLSVIGDLDWKCRDIGPGAPLAYKGGENYMTSYYVAQKEQQGGVISFTREEAFLVLPSWKSTLSGSISLQFRTNEPNGLLLFNSGGNPGKDFFAMELLDGHLHVHLDLGSGAVKIRASRVQLNDGNWHRVELTLRKRIGRITIDGDTEAFETPGEANQLDLVGSLYVGSVDYMDPYLRLPPALWSATLRYGFVGCLKDLFINGASIDIVTYAHQQDVGSIRSSCHKMPGQCHDRPCMHGGTCSEGWNRYICDCSQTSFTGATCGNSAATLKFSGQHSMSLRYNEGVTNEGDDIAIRFRTVEQAGILLTTRHDRSQDKLEITLEGGRVRISMQLGLAEKTLFVGQSLNDDIYHTFIFKRRGTKIQAIVDDDKPTLAEIMGTNSLMSFSELHIGGIDAGSLVTSTAPGFRGSLQQFVINGEQLFELARSGQLASQHALNAQLVESNHEETVHHAVSFAAQNTYIGLPQMKVYNSINIRFQFRTFEQNGLLLYNAGKASDFIAVELVNGRLHYTLNLGYGPISIKDNAGSNGQGTLSDNKWHTVIIGRPSRYRHTLMVDGHIATATTRGDNYHLDLDGILFLGGVQNSMYGSLPRPLLSTSGFQGCIASLETNGELLDPMKHALVPSPLVEEGCEESVAYQWGNNGGSIKFSYPSDKLPDTSEDLLSLGFITPSFDAVLVRIDSHPDAGTDYLQLVIEGGKLFLNYNLGYKDITIGDMSTKVNDGRYHVVRFTRSDINSTMQVDDNKAVHTKFPQGSKQQSKMVVFNDQSVVQIGGRWNGNLRHLERPFLGVMTGVVYNGLRPLDLAADKDPRAQLEGDVRLLSSIPFDYREQHPELFTKDAVKLMIDKVYANNRANDLSGGSGDNGNGLGFINCDDEEDCIAGSGSGDGYNGNVIGGDTNGRPGTSEEIWYPGGTDSRYVPLSTSHPDSGPFQSTSDWAILLYPETTPAPPSYHHDPDDIHLSNGPPTLLPLPVPPGGGDDDTDQNKNYVSAFDEKWNVEDAPTEKPEPPPISTRSMPGTMVLVIGIILGAFVAMILIVIIVLKMRTRVDGSIKCEDAAPRYQFAPPNDYGELGGEQETATTSLMEGSVAPPVSSTVQQQQQPANQPGLHNNGLFNNNCPPMMRPPSVNGDRSRLFRKSNGSKPVREWYV